MIEKEKKRKRERRRRRTTTNEYNWVYEESPLIIFKHYYSRWHIYITNL